MKNIKVAGNRFSRSLLTIILALAVFASSINTYSEDSSTSHVHDGITFTPWSSTNSLPGTAGNYYLSGDVSISSTWSVPSGTTNLCLNGHGIRMTGSGRVISVGKNTLNLYDCDSETGHRFSVASPYSNGAGLATVNDALTSDYMTFTGGYITGGSGNGAGIYVSGGTVNMYGGTVIGNQTGGDGGAIYAERGGTFNMYGGTISCNKAKNGGGIYAPNITTFAKINISGGRIEKNAAIGGHGGALYGGTGVPVSLSGSVVITGNWASGAGAGGITASWAGSSAHFNIQGNLYIYDNYNENGRSDFRGATSANVLKVVGNLSADTKIGLVDVVAGVYDYYNSSFSHKDIDVSEMFIYNDPNYALVRSGNDAVKTQVYTVTFDSKGMGTAPDDVKAPSGTVITLPGALSADGYCFTGWNDGSTTYAAGGQFTVNGATSFTAVWTPAAARVTNGSSVNDYTSFSAALNNWQTGSTLKLFADAEVAGTITVPSGAHTLDLNGYGIKKTGSGAVIKIPGGAELAITDSRSAEGTHYYYIDSSTRLAVLTETEGAAQSGNSAKNGSFTGGYIYGGSNPSGTSEGGGGITVLGKLTMNGGTVIGNYVAGAGGGICVYNAGTANLTGTGIIGNKTGNVGAGVDVNTDSGTPILVMDNCVIRHNHAQSNTGGLAARGGTVTLTDCDVTDNTAQTNTAGMVAQNCHVTLEDVRIKDNATANYSNAYAPGITLRNNNYSNCSFTVKGTVEIENNTMAGTADDSVFIYNGRNINIGGALTNTTPIKVRHQSVTGVFTTGWKTYMSDKKPEDYFTTVNEDLIIKLDDSGEAKVAPAHTHEWEYSVNGGVITANCVGEETCDLTSQTVTISATGMVYDGTAVTATVTKIENWTAYGLSEPGEITYSGNTDAGTYTASVTAGGKTASVQFTISEKSMAADVSSSGFTGDYDGTSHKITVTAPTGAAVKYGTKSGEYTLDSAPEYTNAGEYTVYYQVTRKNYITVTGSAVVTINAINATVTIVGNRLTLDYDGKAHTVSGYVAEADTELYDVSKDFTFSGDANISETNAGIYNMGLAAEQFVNTNANFSTVTFEVTDGSLTIERVDAIIKTAPQSSSPIYTGSPVQLSVAGKAEGGTIFYAVNKDPQNAPAAGNFRTIIPTATATGSYYVWYLVKADANHIDLPAASVRVILAEEGWVTLSGTLYQKDGVTPAGDAVVTLTKENEEIDYAITGADGSYQFIVPAGVYSLVAKYEQGVQTTMVSLFSDETQSVVMNGGNTQSHLQVDSGSEDEFEIAVDGLGAEAAFIRKNENIPEDRSVSVLMTVEAKTVKSAQNSKKITSSAKDKSLIFFDAKVEKTIDSDKTVLDETETVLELAVPYEKVSKRGVAVYFSDGDGTRAFRESTSKKDGTFTIDKENGVVYIYTRRFSTFAIGYTPYYKVQSPATLGSFTGTVSVIVTDEAGETVSKLENIAMKDIVFADIAKGQYTVTVTWTDGVENTLAFPLTIGDK